MCGEGEEEPHKNNVKLWDEYIPPDEDEAYNTPWGAQFRKTKGAMAIDPIPNGNLVMEKV